MIKRKEETITFEKALSLFTNEKKVRGLTEKTIIGYEDSVRQFLSYSGISSEALVSSLKKENVINYSLYLQGKNISPQSVNAYLRPIRCFINWCYKNEYIPKIKVEMMKCQEERIKFFTDEELEVLVRKPNKDCDFVEYRTWMICCFILGTGARVGTIVNIKLEDLGSFEVTYRHTKNKKSQTVPLSMYCYTMLMKYIEMWEIDNYEYLFPDQYGDQATTSCIRQALKKYCKRRGIEPKGPHALRHSFARGWIKNGGGVFQLQQMLGHSDITMTRKYVKLFSDDLKDEIIYTPLETLAKPKKKIK